MFYYENIGIEKIKLVERGMTTEALSKIVDAYTKRSYDGNFLDLVPTMSKYMYIAKNDYYQIMESFFHVYKINIFKLFGINKLFNKLKRSHEYYKDMGVYIDNKKLDNVLANLIKTNCSSRHCIKCNFCSEIAKKVVEIRYNKNKYLENLNNLKEFLDNLVSGYFFH